jgi:hypothetical protein
LPWRPDETVDEFDHGDCLKAMLLVLFVSDAALIKGGGPNGPEVRKSTLGFGDRTEHFPDMRIVRIPPPNSL